MKSMGSTEEATDKYMNFVFNIEEAKLAINNVLWMYSNPTVTIGELEDRAIRILKIVMEDKE